MGKPILYTQVHGPTNPICAPVVVNLRAFSYGSLSIVLCFRAPDHHLWNEIFI